MYFLQKAGQFQAREENKDFKYCEVVPALFIVEVRV